jgi:ribosome biogenesis GTPase A
MAKALKEIKHKEKLINLFLITLDARAPLSSLNSEFDKIAPHKPRIYIITKKDLGDQAKIDLLIKNHGDKLKNLLVVNLKQARSRKIILKKMKPLLKEKQDRDLLKGIINPQSKIMVLGIPNSGKSTLINLLAQKKQAKVGNEPGVTRGQQ